MPHRDCASNSGACTDLPPPLWAGTHEKCGSIFHGNRRRAGVGLLAARTVFLQAHVYIHQERSGVCKQGSEQTAGTPIITLPPPQPSPAALRCGGGSRTANDLTTVRPFFHRTAPSPAGRSPQRGRAGVGVSDVACYMAVPYFSPTFRGSCRRAGLAPP